MGNTRAEDPNHLGTNLRLVLGGDAAALNALLERLRPYLHLLVREQLASAERYREDGSDIVQETLMRVYRGLDLGAADEAHFRGQTVPQFLNWVGVVVRNAVVQHLKHRKAAKRDQGREVPGSKIFPLLVLGMTSENSLATSPGEPRSRSRPTPTI
jgi:DNA-directed RNA polymerase specialized sigma24 family protein